MLLNLKEEHKTHQNIIKLLTCRHTHQCLIVHITGFENVTRQDVILVCTPLSIIMGILWLQHKNKETKYQNLGWRITVTKLWQANDMRQFWNQWKHLSVFDDSKIVAFLVLVKIEFKSTVSATICLTLPMQEIPLHALPSRWVYVCVHAQTCTTLTDKREILYVRHFWC